MKIHVREGDIHLLDVRTRMPFKYGIATMTSTPHLFLRLRVEVDGKLATGIAADNLPPKWFTKDPSRPIAEETHEMLRVVEHALSLATGLRADTPFDGWLAVHQAQSEWGKAECLPPLLTQFGTSLVERATIEAVCRAAGRPFRELLQGNVFGPCLEGVDVENHRAAPLRRLIVRHTVGLADPLRDEDISPEERQQDGLPQSLASCVRAYGLRHFKIKVSGSLADDRERLRRVADVLERETSADFAFSLDGNEQFTAWAGFRAFWEELRHDPDLENFFGQLLFVEQPLHRSVALKPQEGLELRRWSSRPPIIIDESDDEPDAMMIAWSFGYAGTSHKNCKGVFKSISNVALAEVWRRERPGHTYVVTGEDLANIGPVALLQDLTVCAALGIRSVERNGHHYFAGLSMFPPDIQQQALRHHGDLYHASRDGWPTLNIRNGEVDVGSLLEAPFGVGFEVPVERFLTPDQWRRANPLPERSRDARG